MEYFGTFRAHEGAGAGGGGTHRPPAPGLFPRRARTHVCVCAACSTRHSAQSTITGLDVANENDVVTRLPALLSPLP